MHASRAEEDERKRQLQDDSQMQATEATARPPTAPPLSYSEWITLMQEYPGTLLSQAGLFNDPIPLQTLAELTTLAQHHSQGIRTVPTTIVISQFEQQQLQPSSEHCSSASVDDWVEDVSWPGSLTEEVNINPPSIGSDAGSNENIFSERNSYDELDGRQSWDDNKSVLMLSAEEDTYPLLSYCDENGSGYDAESSLIGDTDSFFSPPSWPDSPRNHMITTIQPQKLIIDVCSAPDEDLVDDNSDSIVQIKEEGSEPEYELLDTQTAAYPIKDNTSGREDSADQLSSDEYREDSSSSKSGSVRAYSSSDGDFTVQSARAYRLQHTVAHQKRTQQQCPGGPTTKRRRTQQNTAEQDLLIHEKAAEAALRDASEKRTRSQTGYEPYVTNYLKRLFFEVYVRSNRCKLSKIQREAAAKFTNLLPRRITYWFSNRRRRLTQTKLETYRALCRNKTIDSFEEYVSYLKSEQRGKRQRRQLPETPQEEEQTGSAQSCTRKGRGRHQRGRGRGRGRDRPLVM